jgi:rare lipoprotein A
VVQAQEERNYAKVGAASWYGDAFHGRLTANGEVYDMTHLTAAHPTMPLPSYARVTNTKNGASVIVRVNDRGPFAHNRIIDLSKRAADLLDYRHAGVAKVKVEYVGRAPLHGRDDNYLLASYKPGQSGIGRPGPVEIDDGLPAGVMIAMAGDTPTTKRSMLARMSTQNRNVAPPPPSLAPMAGVGMAAVAVASDPLARPLALGDAPAPMEPAFGEVLASDPVLPDFGPTIPERPYDGFLPGEIRIASATLSYADQRIGDATRAIDGAMHAELSPDDVRAAWKRLGNAADGQQPAADIPQGEYVAAGTYDSRGEAEAVASQLRAIGAVTVTADGDAFTVELRDDGRHRPDLLAELARRSGAPDAFLVRE